MLSRVLIVLLSTTLLMAQMPGHHKYHTEFYSKLFMKDGKTSCCNEKDCGPTPHRNVNGKWQVKVEGKWIEPPQDVIQYHVTPDGKAHTCGFGGASEVIGEVSGFYFFCVIIPKGLF